MATVTKYASRALAEAHETARGMFRNGLISKERMAEFDALCLPEGKRFSPEGIKALRQRVGQTQVELADRLGISPSTLRQWEIGAKKPSGPSLKLLDILDRKGLEGLM